MADNKRKHSPEPADSLYSNKSRSRPSATARLDPTYGQRSAFPVDEEGEEDADLEYDEDMDAFAYLKSVRREAGGIPHLLVAPKAASAPNSRDIYSDGVGDYRGRYKDGAFYAEPTSHSSDDEEDEEASADSDPQSQFFSSILTRFHTLRSQLAQTPPLAALQNLDEDHPIYLGPLIVPKVRWWRWKLRTTDPLPVQVASMDKDTVLGLLKLMAGGALLRRGMEVEMGVSRWAWSLLAKLPERGELSSEEIGVVRELGKKAVLVAVGIREGNRWEEGMAEVEAGFDGDGEGEGEAVYGVNEEEIPIDDDEVVFEADNDEEEEEEEVIPEPEEEELVSQEKAVQSNGTAPETPTEPTTTSDELSDLAAAKARILAMLTAAPAVEEPAYNIEPEPPSPVASDLAASENGNQITQPQKVTNPASIHQKYNSHATVDMILTIAGEVFGQRDLLEFRGSWGDIV